MNCLLHDFKYNLRLLERNSFHSDVIYKKSKITGILYCVQICVSLRVGMTSAPANFNGRHRVLLH